MIDTGGGGFSGSSSSGASAGDSGNYSSSADRVSKQFISMGGASGLDAASYLGAVSQGFWQSVNATQATPENQAAAVGVKGTDWVKIAAVAGAVTVALVFVIKRGGK